MLDILEELLSLVEPVVMKARERDEMDTASFRRYQAISAEVADLRSENDHDTLQAVRRQ